MAIGTRLKKRPSRTRKSTQVRNPDLAHPSLHASRGSGKGPINYEMRCQQILELEIAPIIAQQRPIRAPEERETEVEDSMSRDFARRKSAKNVAHSKVGKDRHFIEFGEGLRHRVQQSGSPNVGEKILTVQQVVHSAMELQMEAVDDRVLVHLSIQPAIVGYPQRIHLGDVVDRAV